MQDGIYFDLPEQNYHEIERLSSSGCAKLLMSPADFWASSWMNPTREDDAKEETNAQILGSAYHMARLEPDRFAEIYARRPVEADFPTALLKDDEIKSELKSRGEAMTKAGEKKLERAIRLKSLGYSQPIFEIILDEFNRSLGKDQIAIDGPYYDQLMKDVEAIHKDKSLSRYVEGGYSEVTVLWTDALGVQWKCRIDYLSLWHVLDMKTFENYRKKSTDMVITQAIQYEGYWLQAFIYWHAVQLTKAGELPVIEGDENQKLFIENLRANKNPHEFWWLFQQKSGVPNTLLKLWAMTQEPITKWRDGLTDDSIKHNIGCHENPSFLARKAATYMEHCAKIFQRNQEIYGVDEWRPIDPTGTIGDADFSDYFLNE